MATHPTPEFVPLRSAAATLGLSQSWLKSMIEAGSVPAIRDGRRLFVHLDETRTAVAELARKNPAIKPEGGEA